MLYTIVPSKEALLQNSWLACGKHTVDTEHLWLHFTIFFTSVIELLKNTTGNTINLGMRCGGWLSNIKHNPASAIGTKTYNLRAKLANAK